MISQSTRKQPSAGRLCYEIYSIYVENEMPTSYDGTEHWDYSTTKHGAHSFASPTVTAKLETIGHTVKVVPYSL